MTLLPLSAKRCGACVPGEADWWVVDVGPALTPADVRRALVSPDPARGRIQELAGKRNVHA